ncbi:MAG: thiamine pyrophosphate-dependent enzyme [Rubrivivax sp.]
MLCTAVEYELPVVWVIWNNFAWAAIRDIQYGLFDGREISTAFYKGEGGQRYNPDFAAWARACGADGITVTRPQELAGAVELALKNKRPCRHRRARGRRRAAAFHRHLATAADSVQGTGVRQAVRRLSAVALVNRQQTASEAPENEWLN